MNFKEYLVILDDGHGIDTPGKRTPFFKNTHTQTKENEFNRPVVQQLKMILTIAGFNVYETAPELEDIPLKTRVKRANDFFKDHKRIIKKENCIFISVHYNAQDHEWGGTDGGIETWFCKGSKNGKRLAGEIQKELIENTPQRNRGIKAGTFYVLKNTFMPAVLLECGFMDVKKEAELMKSKEFINEVAEEIFIGILDYFKISKGDKYYELYKSLKEITIKFQEE